MKVKKVVVRTIAFSLFIIFSLKNSFAQTCNLTLTATTTSPLCNGGTNGTVTATAGGGSDSYKYELSLASAMGWQSSNVMSGHIAGT